MHKLLKPLAAILFFLCASAVRAQTTTGTLVGTVVDPSGATLSSVSIKAIETDTNRRFDGETNNSGNYSIPNLPAGSYILEVQRAGFKTTVQSGIEVRVNENTRFNVVMEVGPLAETVTSKGQLPYSRQIAPPSGPQLPATNSNGCCSTGGNLNLWFSYSLER